MRILVAFDSFKECCSAATVCQSVAQGLVRSDLEIDVCPLADGGEGTLDAISRETPLIREAVTAIGPLGEPVRAELAWLEGMPPDWASLFPGIPTLGRGRVAFIECASCIGLALVQERQRNPLRTTSYGLGQLIQHARENGAGLICVGLGGSSTVDGGIGMAQALGVRCRGAMMPASGGDLAQVASIDPILPVGQPETLHVVIATDVRSPLLGTRGAARVFGPQKGATPAMVEHLERGLSNYARHLFQACVRQCDDGPSKAPTIFEQAIASPGAGAAGGIGFALQQIFRATTISGVDWVMRAVKFDERLEKADLVITGEGKLDHSSFEGKVISGVVSRAVARRVPVHVICGSSALSISECESHGISRVQTLLDLATSIADSKGRAQELLLVAAARAV